MRCMNRRLLEMHLDRARRHVRTGADDIARQRAVVDELQRDGHDTALARKLLASFETLQAMHVDEAARLTAELAALPE